MADKSYEICLTRSEVYTMIKATMQTMKDLNKLKENEFVTTSRTQDFINTVHNVYNKLVALVEDE